MICDLLRLALPSALSQLAAISQRIELRNTDEFTFRSLVCVALKSLEPGLQLETEWNFHDLAVFGSNGHALIEFKYYIHREKRGIDGRPTGWKGGPSSGNEKECRRCVDDLRARALPPAWEKLMVVLYELDRGQGRGYQRSYDDPVRVLEISPYASIAIPDGLPVRCHLFRVT